MVGGGGWCSNMKKPKVGKVCQTTCCLSCFILPFLSSKCRQSTRPPRRHHSVLRCLRPAPTSSPHFAPLAFFGRPPTATHKRLKPGRALQARRARKGPSGPEGPSQPLSRLCAAVGGRPIGSTPLRTHTHTHTWSMVSASSFQARVPAGPPAGILTGWFRCAVGASEIEWNSFLLPSWPLQDNVSTSPWGLIRRARRCSLAVCARLEHVCQETLRQSAVMLPRCLQ